MALHETLALLGCGVEPPLWLCPAANGPDIGMEIDQPSGGARRWRGGYEAVDVVLGVRRLLVAMDVVVTRLAQRSALINPVDQMHPVEIALPIDVVVKICPRPRTSILSRKCSHVVTAEAEIEVGRVPSGWTRQGIFIPGPSYAAVDRAVGTDRGGG